MAAKGWRTEDWVAVYLGFVIIGLVLAAFSWKWFDLDVTRPTFRWTADSQIAGLAPGWRAAVEGIGKEADAKGKKELAASAGDLKTALDKGERKAIEKAAGGFAKAGGRNTVAGALGGEIRGHAAATTDKVFSGANLLKVLYLGIAWLVVGAVGGAGAGAASGAATGGLLCSGGAPSGGTGGP